MMKTILAFLARGVRALRMRIGLPADEPLIWTTKGNVPERSLQHYIQWDNTPSEVSFSEIYTTPDGEIVKRSAHVMKKTGEAMTAGQAQL